MGTRRVVTCARRWLWAVGLVGCANTASGTAGTAMDAATDARTDVSRDDAGDVWDGGRPDVPLTVPRLIRPFSNMIATHRRPELRWELPAGVTDVTVRICHDRACTQVEHTLAVTGTRVRPPEDLAPGVHFWNVEARGDGGALRSYTWAFRTLNGQREVDTTWEGGADFNGDGCSDVIVVRLEPQNGFLIEVFYGHRDRSRSPSPDAVIRSPDFGGIQAGTVQPAGDVDGDGYSDLIVASSTRPFSRHAVYRGAEGGLSMVPAWTLERPNERSVGPVSVGFGGDLDGTGHGAWLFSENADAAPPARQSFLYAATLDGGDWALRLLAPDDTTNMGLVAAADFDGDGLHDTITFPSVDEPVITYGPGEATSRTQTFGINTLNGRGLLLELEPRCDFDGDGRSDVALLHSRLENTTNQVWFAWFPSRTERTVVRLRGIGTPPQGFGSSSSLRCAADFDGDGILEVVGTWPSDSDQRLVMQQFHADSGSFEATTARIEQPPTCAHLATLGDYDGDGLGDIVCARRNSSATVGVIFGGSRGSIGELQILRDVPAASYTTVFF